MRTSSSLSSLLRFLLSFVMWSRGKVLLVKKTRHDDTILVTVLLKSERKTSKERERERERESM